MLDFNGSCSFERDFGNLTETLDFCCLILVSGCVVWVELWYNFGASLVSRGVREDGAGSRDSCAYCYS